jgi:hypothetical protein
MSPTPFNRSMFRDRASGGFATPGRPSMGFSGMSQPAQLGVAQGGGGIQGQLQSTLGGLETLNDRISSYANNASQEANQLASMVNSTLGGGSGMSQQGFRTFAEMNPGPLAPYMRQVLQQQMEAQRSNPSATGNMLGLARGGEAKKSSFPDLTGDGEVTYADILKGRGVEFANEGGIMSTQMGGETMADMPFMAPEEEAMILQQAQNLPPEVMQMANTSLNEASQELNEDAISSAVEEEVGQTMSSLDMAGDFKELMNVVWQDDADVEFYRSKLASVVGPEDAQRTPDSVLALVQPTLQLAEIDKGIGALMQEELADVADVSGGITEIGSQGAVADGMAAETGALVDAVGNMAQGPSGIMATGTEPMGMDPQMLESMMQGMA